MRKDPIIFLNHINDAIELINKFTEGFTKAKFLADKLVQSAVVRQIEIIGEATKNLPRPFKSAHPEAPWKDIAGMRDKLVHHYFGVDLNYVWGVIKDELPHLQQQIQHFLRE